MFFTAHATYLLNSLSTLLSHVIPYHSSSNLLSVRSLLLESRFLLPDQDPSSSTTPDLLPRNRNHSTTPATANAFWKITN